MKKISFLFMTLIMCCLSASAIDKVVKTNELKDEITSLDALKSAQKFLLQDENGNLIQTHGSGNYWDCVVADIATTTAKAKNACGACFSLVEVNGKYLMQVYHLDGSNYKYWAGDGFVNAQPGSGNVIFALSGAASKYGQDMQDGALWTVAYVDGKGFSFLNGGRAIYLASDNSAARPSDTEKYWKAYAGYDSSYDKDVLASTKKQVLEATKFTDDIAAINSAANDDALAEAINAAIDALNELEAIEGKAASFDEAASAVYAELKAKYADNGVKNISEYFDAYVAAVKAQTAEGSNMTDAIVNPNFETNNTNGWTSNNGPYIANNRNFGAMTGGNFVEKWTGAPTLTDGKLYQTITGIQNGVYELTAEMQLLEQSNGSANGTGFYLVANTSKVEVKTAGETVKNTVKIADGSLTIGVSLENASGNWACADNFQLTYVRALNTTELAQAEYENTLAEAEELLEYANAHKGVGIMLYLPAKVEEYAENLSIAEIQGGSYAIYNDYKEGTDLLNYLMCELQPQYPKLNQRYLVKHKVSGLYLNADSGVKLSPNATPVAFHHVDGAKEDARFFMYSTPDREYICYEGSNAWTMTNQAISVEGGKFVIKHNHTNQAYNLVGMNGALGTDAKAVDSPVYGNKAEDAANSQWLFEIYDEPEVVITKPVVATTTLATDGETIQYFYNKETNAFFSQGNAWGTQASYYEKKGNQFKVSISDGVTEIYDLATAGGSQKWMNPFIDGQGGLYVDNGSASNSHAWAITVLEDGGFEIANTELATDKKVGIDPAEAKNIIQMTNAAGAYTTWYAVSEADFNQYLADLEAYEQWVRENTELQPGTDLTYLATEGFSSAVGNVGTVADWAWSGHEGANEVYNGSGAVPAGDVLVQTISNLQNGVYEVTLEVAASFTSGRGFEANVGEGLAEAFANSAVQAIEVYDRSSVAADGADQVTLTAIVSDGTLKFGVRNVADGGNWYLAYLKQIVFVSKDVKSMLNKNNEATEITSVSSDATPAAIFSANGARLQSMQKGMNIVRMSNGQVKKIFIK